MPYEPIENSRMYQRAEAIGDRIWEIVLRWDWFAKHTLGAQWVNAADSMGANIAEGGGRYHPKDVKNFLYHARGSLRETKFWMRRALQRDLIENNLAEELDWELEQLSREINEKIRYRAERLVKEGPVEYEV